MKTVKKVADGLVLYDQCNTRAVHPPLRSNANLDFTDASLIINSGRIDMDTFSYHDLVFELHNGYVPRHETDVGGISIYRGAQSQALFEYYAQGETAVVPYVKLVKHGEVYYGYGSEDGQVWEDKGHVVFGHADKIGITVKGTTPYELYSLKVYKKEYITLYAVLPGWKVKVWQNGSVVADEAITAEHCRLALAAYPFTGDIAIYDEQGNSVVQDKLVEVWGGDEYCCTLDVDLLTEDDVPLAADVERHLGNLVDGTIKGVYKVRNNRHEAVAAVLRIAPYSPFKDWAMLAEDHAGKAGAYENEILLHIPGGAERTFWLRVKRPPDAGFVDYDFKKTECLFYLEVV